MIDFLGIGSQKAATTWIYENLNHHPQVNFPVGKEVHFWDRGKQNGKRVDDWLGLFPDNSAVKQGEITPAYGFLDREIIQEIHNTCPDLKIFYSLRNPIDRAWSSALMALERAEMLPYEASDKWFIDHFKSEGSLQRGDHERCLKNWRAVFPESQILLVFFEDIVLQPRAVLQQLAMHIGVDPDFFNHLSGMNLRQPINSGFDLPIRPTLLPFLHQIYDEKIDSLQTFIGRDLTYWKNSLDSKDVLILTGMHRSGTSVTASLLQQLGVNLGDNLLPGNATNIKGFFEDIDFLRFQESLLIENLPSDRPGWTSWGWLEEQEFDSSQLETYIGSAQVLLTQKKIDSHIWGWKDPRTTLLLDFWYRLLPNASYLLIYRYPWDVADSIQRLQAPPFSEHPEYGSKIWYAYNHRILKFYLAHQSQCVLANVNTLLQQPEFLLQLLQGKLHLNLSGTEPQEAKVSLKAVYEPTLLKVLEWEDEQVQQFQDTHPECIELLTELDLLADISSPFTSSLQSDDSTDYRPLISIVIPCFNQGDFLLEALASIARCTEARSGLTYEVIIVNDGSTEPTSQNILNCLSQKNYTVIHQENQGLSIARNVAIQQAKGKYILPLDADNKIRSGFLQKSIDILEEHPRVGVVYSDVAKFGEEISVFQVPDFDLTQLLLFNYIDACAIFRKSVWEECGGYDSMPHKLGYEDWEFWINVAKRGWRLYHIPEVLFDYRVRSDSMAENCGKPENQKILYEYICKKHQGVYSKYLPEIFSRQQFYLRREYFNARNYSVELSKVEAKLESTQKEVEKLRKQIEKWKSLVLKLKQLQSVLVQNKAQSQELKVELSKTQVMLEEISSSLIEVEPGLELFDL